ncbi:MAG: hypothetical protein FJ225_02150 [Lentisphaerae bacterium]|nr:hypothetical protein [Lentisphaerota bacterium]
MKIECRVGLFAVLLGLASMHCRGEGAGGGGVGWEEIDKIYGFGSERTEEQKAELWGQYKGKKVQWKGTVTSVSETWGNLAVQVRMNPATLTSDVLIILKESERDKASRLKVGTSATFEGLLDAWGAVIPISLVQGEILQWDLLL